MEITRSSRFRRLGLVVLPQDSTPFSYRGKVEVIRNWVNESSHCQVLEVARTSGMIIETKERPICVTDQDIEQDRLEHGAVIHGAEKVVLHLREV